MRPPTRVSCLAALAVAALASTQTTAQRGGQGPSPVFRTVTDMVLVDAIVTDRNDRVMSGLTRDDFTITLGGRGQRIAEFSFEFIPPADRHVDLDAPTQPPADVASNAQTSRTSRAFVFVIDDARTPLREIVPLKRLMNAMLNTLSPDDQAAIIYTSRSDLGSDFTNDMNRLIDVVNNRREAMGLGLPFPQRSLMITLRNVVKTLQASKHARRAVFLVGPTGCVPHPPNPDWEECLDLVKRARQADVPFYVLDPRLFIDGDVVSYTDPDARAAATATELAMRDEMMTLTSATGGRTMSRAADPVKAATSVMLENGAYYLLGFYPDPAVADGKFHDIKVTVNRPGLYVRARRGYIAPEPVRRPSTATRDMTATLGAGLDDPGLPIRAFAAPIGPGANGRTRTLVTVEVTYPRDTTERALDEDLRVGILALTPDAKIKASFQRPFHLTGTWLDASTGTFVINEAIDLPSERLALRVGVTSRALGKSGTAHLYVDSPDFRDKDLVLGGLVLGDQAADPGIDQVMGLDSLRTLVPFQPTTRRTFSTGDTIRVFTRAFWKRDAASAGVTVLVVGGEGLPPKSVTIEGRRRPDGGREATLDLPLPLAGLARGAHVLRVEAALPGAKPVVRQVPFEVK
jgi:VWFA-related protein